MYQTSFGAEFLASPEAPLSVAGGGKWMDHRTGYIYYGDVRVE